MQRTRHAVILAAHCATAATVRGQTQPPLYLNPDRPVDQRFDDLISRLKLYEKAEMICTTAPAIERLQIPVFNGWNQCLRGIQWSEPTTVFPCPIAMAATWDAPLVQSVASAVSDEGRAIYNSQGRAMYWLNVRKNGLVYRSPVLNISRDPRWGRIAEVWGEAPTLTRDPRRVLLLYANRREADILFGEELQQMERNGFPDLKVVHILSEPTPNWTGESGRLDADRVIQWTGGADDKVFYLCCPPPMTRALLGGLKRKGVSSRSLRTDFFAI